MGLKRVRMSASTATELDDEEQRDLIQDFENAVSGEDIGGYTVSSEGWVWIDFEGPETAVEAVIEDFVADSRIDEYEIKNQEFPSDRELQTEWYGFDEESAAVTIDF